MRRRMRPRRINPYAEPYFTSLVWGLMIMAVILAIISVATKVPKILP